MKSDRMKWFAIFFLVGVLISIVDRAYYTMYFLPEYHGSYMESVKHIIDVDGFVAFIKTVPGAILTGGMLFCFTGAALCLFVPVKMESKTITWFVVE